MADVLPTDAVVHFARTNQVVLKSPNLPDPVTLYKAGEEPRRVHRIDIAGWLANGWGEEPVSEQVEPEKESKPELLPEPAVSLKRHYNRKKQDETE